MAFSLSAATSLADLKIAITAASVVSLVVLCALALGAAGVRRRPGLVFAVSALALLAEPVAYTLHLGEVNLILAALAGIDLSRRHDDGWWQGPASGTADLWEASPSAAISSGRRAPAPGTPSSRA